MASLESLSNPLERLTVLPTTMNLRKNPATGLPYWDATIQYFINDVVISPITEGAYICSGGTQDQSAVRGGVDPSADTTGVWWSTTVQGVSNSAVFTSAAPIVGAANVITLPAGSTLNAPAGSTWLVSLNGSTSCPLAITAADYSTYTFTAAGAGGVGAVLDIQPLVGPTAQRWSSSATLTVGAGGTITVAGAYAGQVPTVATGLRITYVRIA
jgi:hypothetical protein